MNIVPEQLDSNSKQHDAKYLPYNINSCRSQQPFYKTEMPKDEGKTWYQRPLPLACVVGAALLLLNLWFW